MLPVFAFRLLVLGPVAIGAQAPSPSLEAPSVALPARPAAKKPTVRVWYWPPVVAADPAPSPPSEVGSRPAVDVVYFPPNSPEILDAAEALLGVAEWLKANPGVPVTLHGHTDPNGTKETNQKLSERRAEAVKAALVKAGVPEIQLSVIGHGAADPVAGATLEETGRLSRRVAIQYGGSSSPSPQKGAPGPNPKVKE